VSLGKEVTGKDKLVSLFLLFLCSKEKKENRKRELRFVLSCLSFFIKNRKPVFGK